VARLKNISSNLRAFRDFVIQRLIVEINRCDGLKKATRKSQETFTAVFSDPASPGFTVLCGFLLPHFLHQFFA